MGTTLSPGAWSSWWKCRASGSRCTCLQNEHSRPARHECHLGDGDFEGNQRGFLETKLKEWWKLEIDGNWWCILYIYVIIYSNTTKGWRCCKDWRESWKMRVSTWSSGMKRSNPKKHGLLGLFSPAWGEGITTSTQAATSDLGALGALGAPATHLTAQGQALGTDLQIMQMDLEASWPVDTLS